MYNINKSKTLMTHISFECKCKLHRTKCKSNQCWNKNKCWYECKKCYTCEKDYVWNPSTGNCKDEKYLASNKNDSIIICDEVLESCNEEINTIPTNFNERKVACKTQSFYILLVFLLVTIVLLIAASIYCYVIQYRRQHLFPFHNTNDKLSKFYIDSIN